MNWNKLRTTHIIQPIMKYKTHLLLNCLLLLIASSLKSVAWTTVEAEGQCAVHPECGVAAFEEQVYVLGGRGKPPVNAYDPAMASWSTLAAPPFTMHHFQAVVLGDRIAVIAGFTGGYPKEDPLTHIWYYLPSEDRWEEGPEIPEARRRGAAGAVVDGDFVYIVSGITNGHWDGHVPWLDRWNWKTGEWTVLEDAPRARDHFHAVIVDGHLLAVGGRRSSASVAKTFDITVPEVDAYELETGIWTTLDAELPTPRAGGMTISYQGYAIMIGGESMSQREAHAEVDIFSFESNQWQSAKPLQQGRHGSGICRIGASFYVAAGNGNRGGSHDLQDIETIDWEELIGSLENTADHSE